jgi:ABC-type lipoprotein export system ATPase subunit
VIFVTHEQDIAAYAERVIVLRDGQVLSDTRRPPALTPVAADHQTAA